MWIADPKAINHILKNSDALYGKQNGVRELLALVSDRGLVWADGSAFSNLVPFQILTWAGDAHKRQRRAMSPAFGLVEAKALLPYFAQSVAKVSSCFMSVELCDRRVLPVAGRQMARVDRELRLWRVLGHRYTFVA